MKFYLYLQLILEKIKHFLLSFLFLKKIYKGFMEESLIFTSIEEESPKWEKKLLKVNSFIIIVGILIRIFYIDWFQEYPYFCGFYFFFFSVINSFLLFRGASRDYKNVKAYYKKRQELSRNNILLVQKRFIFTTFLGYKVSKPTFKFLIAGFISASAGIGSFEVGHKWIYPDQQTPLQKGGQIFRGYTGYPPESWDIPEVKARKEIEALKEQLQNQEIQHNQDLEKLRRELMEEIEKKNSKKR